MPAAVKNFEHIARPVAHSDDAHQWHGPVTTAQVGGAELQIWCELPRLDPQLDANPWLVLPDCPGGAPDLNGIMPLRRTDTPWWSYESAGSASSDWSSLCDIDLQRMVEEAVQVADWLGLKQFHVMTGGFGSILALALAAHAPERVASIILGSLFMPLRPVSAAYLRALHQCDPRQFESVFGLRLDPRAFGQCVVDMDVRDAVQACQVWVELESRLGLSPLRRDDPTIIRARRTLAHLLMHDFFLSADQWVRDLETLVERVIPITLIQGQGDGVCRPSGSRLLADLLPQACLVELPDVGHSPRGSLALSALTEAVLDHRRPRAKLIRWPGQRMSRPA